MRQRHACGTLHSVKLIERLLEIDVSALSDADKTLPVVDPAVKAMIAGVRMAGPAFTVVAADDHLPVLSALAEAAPGDVLVIATGGGSVAVYGELFATEAQRRGLAGIVADGYCRDLQGLRRIGLPVFARGATPRSGTTVSQAARGATITCGGVGVAPGDIVFGDDDGLLIAPPNRIEAALETAEAIGRAERAILAAAARGEALHDLTNHASTWRRSPRARPARSPSGSMPDLTPAFARRTRLRGGEELSAILAGSPPGVLSMTGGFPNPATFPSGEVGEIAARLVREDAGVALQYAPGAGIASVREYLRERQAEQQGLRPAAGRADGHQRRDGVHRPDVPGAARSRRHGRRRGADLPRRADRLQRRRGPRRLRPDGRGRSAGRRARSTTFKPAGAPSSSTRSPTTRTRPAARSRSSAAARWSSCAAGTAC